MQIKWRSHRRTSRSLPGCNLDVKKYPTEAVEWEEARLRHPDHYLVVADCEDEEGDTWDAIFVWRSREASDKEEPVAVYWHSGLMGCGCGEDSDIESDRSLGGPLLIFGGLIFIAYLLAVALELLGAKPLWTSF
jgi:hypothetical protein